jgi:hypothetical protein
LPYLGTLELRKKDTKVKYINDKLVVTRPIKWKDTLKLWHEDPEARE